MSVWARRTVQRARGVTCAIVHNERWQGWCGEEAGGSTTCCQRPTLLLFSSARLTFRDARRQKKWGAKEKGTHIAEKHKLFEEKSGSDPAKSKYLQLGRGTGVPYSSEKNEYGNIGK